MNATAWHAWRSDTWGQHGHMDGCWMVTGPLYERYQPRDRQPPGAIACQCADETMAHHVANLLNVHGHPTP